MIKKLSLMQQRRKIQRQKGDDHKFDNSSPYFLVRTLYSKRTLYKKEASKKRFTKKLQLIKVNFKLCKYMLKIFEIFARNLKKCKFLYKKRSILEGGIVKLRLFLLRQIIAPIEQFKNFFAFYTMI